MKKCNWILMTLIIVLFYSNVVLAKESNKYINPSIENKVIEEKNDYIMANLNVPIIIIKDNKAISTKISNKIYNDIMVWKSDLIELAKTYKADYEKDNLKFKPFNLLANYKIKYDKNNILSILIDYDQYTGGAHGLTTKIAYNFNLDTGENLKLAQLFKEGFNYKSEINEYIVNEIKKNPQDYFNNGEGFKGIREKQDFYIANDGLVIYFQLYDIAPYVSGIREFKVPYNLLENGLKYKLD